LPILLDIVGILLSICLLPQIYKIYKTKQVENISYLWQILYIIGIIMHLYYGIYYNLLPIYIPTIIELILILIMILLKLIYSKNNDNFPDMIPKGYIFKINRKMNKFDI
jgi:MtN3 and saliva related transmembrane protein